METTKAVTKKTRVSSSSETADGSKTWELELKLAEKLIDEFQGRNQNGTIEPWMAARIAELLTREQRLKGEKTKETCRKECSELICRLWSLRQERDPRSIWNSINQNLGILVNAGGHKYWLRQTKETKNLEVHCELKTLNRSGLFERLTALDDEQHKLLFFLGTDGLSGKDALSENLTQELLDKLLGLRERILTESSEDDGWRGRLKSATTRKERLSILHGQVQVVGNEIYRIAKELDSRI